MAKYIFSFLLCSAAFTGCSIFKKSVDPLPKPEMVLVKGGQFQMGSLWNKNYTEALPVHTVTISNFYIGKFEVTASLYDAYARRIDELPPDSSSQSNGKLPATNVTWHQAKAYCNYLGYRLPTEQEWEYAARSGGKDMQFSGTSDPDSLYRYGYVQKKLAGQPIPVGLKKPNKLGLYDMSGNVFEWIGAYYPFYPDDGQQPDWDRDYDRILRVIRGGSYDQGPNVASTYWRAAMLHTGKASDVGFRCAADAK